MNSTKQLWADAFSETWHGARHWLRARTVDRLPVIVIRRRTQRERERERELVAFQYGVEAQRAGLAEEVQA